MSEPKIDLESIQQKWDLLPLQEITRWHKDLLSFRLKTNPRYHIPGQFVRIGLIKDDQLITRPYSLVNPSEVPYLEVHFNIIPGGPLTSALAKLEEGDEIYASKQNYGLFTLEQVPDNAKELWCLSTGTGIGPYISIIQENEIWERFERVILLHGVRYLRDLSYQDLIGKIAQKYSERLEYHPVITREEDYPGLKGRITTLLAENLIEKRLGIPISTDRSHIMLCGNPQFIDQTRTLLIERGLKKNLRKDPGHITAESYWKA